MSGPKSAVISAVSRSSHVVSSIVGLTNMPRSARPRDQDFSAMPPAYDARRVTPARAAVAKADRTHLAAADAAADAADSADGCRSAVAHPLADHGGDAVLAHGDAVQGVGDLHGALLMGDDQQLRVLPELLEDGEQPAQVCVVEGG